MPARKRARGDSAAQSGGSRRRSQRVSSTGKKSSYFEDDVDESDDALTRLPRKSFKDKAAAKAGANDEDEADEAQFEEEDDEDDDVGSEDSEDSATPPPRKRGRAAKPAPKRQAKTPSDGDTSRPRKRSRSAKATLVKRTKVEPLGDENDHDEDSDDDGSPQVEFIPLPKLRDSGGVEYTPERVHPNTMEFLKDLKANNVRSWLKLRDPEYRRSLKDWESFVETLTEKVIEADETIPSLPLKDVIFRIYRDIRFSKDPTPYKPHYSVAWSRTGRKGPYACYYVHCEPGSCIVGGGLWNPDKDALAKLRANVDERPHRLRRVLMKPQFRTTFLPKAKSNEESVIAAFVESNKENALKTRPQGFHPEHRDIELLKLRNYTVGKKIKDSDLTGEDAQDKIMAIINPMVEYVTFLNSVVMPDPNFDSDSDDDNEDNEGEGDEEADEE